LYFSQLSPVALGIMAETAARQQGGQGIEVKEKGREKEEY